MTGTMSPVRSEDLLLDTAGVGDQPVENDVLEEEEEYVTVPVHPIIYYPTVYYYTPAYQ